jgi:hypothetical protein
LTVRVSDAVAPSLSDARTITITVHEPARPLPGDLDGSGHVGPGDLAIVLAHWSQAVPAGAWASGDPSGDGFVGQADLDTVLRHWAQGVPEAAAAASASTSALGGEPRRIEPARRVRRRLAAALQRRPTAPSRTSADPGRLTYVDLLSKVGPHRPPRTPAASGDVLDLLSRVPQATRRLTSLLATGVHRLDPRPR